MAVLAVVVVTITAIVVCVIVLGLIVIGVAVFAIGWTRRCGRWWLVHRGCNVGVERRRGRQRPNTVHVNLLQEQIILNFEKVWKWWVAPNDGAHMLEALVQHPKDVEDEDPVFNRCTKVSQTIGHDLKLAAVLIDWEVTLNKSMKGSIKVKSTLLSVTKKLILDVEPKVTCRTTTFPDYLVKIRWDGVANSVEDDAIHPNPPQIIGRRVIRDVLDQGVALESLLHEITPASVVGGGGVEDDVHQLADIEHCGHLKVKSATTVSS
jgi:hypothetical protein